MIFVHCLLIGQKANGALCCRILCDCVIASNCCRRYFFFWFLPLNARRQRRENIQPGKMGLALHRKMKSENRFVSKSNSKCRQTKVGRNEVEPKDEQSQNKRFDFIEWADGHRIENDDCCGMCAARNNFERISANRTHFFALADSRWFSLCWYRIIVAVPKVSVCSFHIQRKWNCIENCVWPGNAAFSCVVRQPSPDKGEPHDLFPNFLLAHFYLVVSDRCCSSFDINLSFMLSELLGFRWFDDASWYGRPHALLSCRAVLWCSRFELGGFFAVVLFLCFSLLCLFLRSWFWPKHIEFICVTVCRHICVATTATLYISTHLRVYDAKYGRNPYQVQASISTKNEITIIILKESSGQPNRKFTFAATAASGGSASAPPIDGEKTQAEEEEMPKTNS